jgi:NADH-quinone oxidoreductase subunit M
MQESAHSFPIFAALAASGIVLGAWYLFTMLKRVFFGPVKEPHHEGPAVRDLDGRELAALLPIVVLCLYIGVHPKTVLSHSDRDLRLVAWIAAEPVPPRASSKPPPLKETP